MVAMHLSVVRPPGTGSVDFRSAFKLSPQTEVYAILHRDLKIIGTLPPCRNYLEMSSGLTK